MASLQKLENQIQDLSRQLTEQKKISEEEIQQAKRAIQELDGKFRNFERDKLNQLKFPLDIFSRKLIEDIIFEKSISLNWDRYLYFHTYFESLDGYSSSGTGSVTLNQSGLVLTTGATSTNSWQVSKSPEYQKVLNWKNIQRMRTNIQLNSVTSVTASAVVGLVGADIHFGFTINNGTLRGTCGNTSQSTVDLLTISANTNYDVEARFFPGNGVIFYVNKLEKGVLKTNLPIGGTSGENLQLMEFKVTTNENVAKNLRLSFFEFIQERFPYPLI